MVAILIAVGLGLAGCGSDPAAPKGPAPANVEVIPGKDVKKVTLTEQAARRLDIKTVTIGAAQTVPPGGSSRSPGTSATVVPYSAVLYDPSGGTWVYTVPQPLTYVREKVVVATVAGSSGTEAVLSEAPPAGTTIVTTGVIELYGAELGVGK